MAGIETLAMEVSSTFMKVASDSAIVPMTSVLPVSGGGAAGAPPERRRHPPVCQHPVQPLAGFRAWLALSAGAGRARQMRVARQQALGAAACCAATCGAGDWFAAMIACTRRSATSCRQSRTRRSTSSARCCASCGRRAPPPSCVSPRRPPSTGRSAADAPQARAASSAMRTGTRCTILIQLPVAFCAGSSANAAPVPAPKPATRAVIDRSCCRRGRRSA